MKKKLIVVLAGCVLLTLMAATAFAGPMFVATAKNLRGAMYLGYGPSPHHASEMAIAKCSQNSVLPPTCRVTCVRMEAPPPCPPPMKMRKPIRKHKPMTKSYPRHNYNWGHATN